MITGTEKIMILQLLNTVIASSGVAVNSPLGIIILLIGIGFTVGLPLLLILKGRKD